MTDEAAEGFRIPATLVSAAENVNNVICNVVNPLVDER
jgi:hypothetical protein